MKKKAWVMKAAAHAIAIAFLVLALTGTAPGQSGGTEALFNLNATSTSPFPSNWFTVPDNTNKTHLRVNLPYPDCETYASDCQDIAVLNELDGFNLLPRLSIPFSGPIDPYTVNSDSVFLVSLGTAGFGGDYMPWGTVIGINQVVWDPVANILHVESDQLLAQHTRFALIVTNKVLDAVGTPVAASETFRHFRGAMREDYKLALLQAIQAARQAGVPEQDIAVASVFTTQSVTAVMEKIRDQIHDPKAQPDPASFLLGPEGYRTVFSLNQVAGITWNQQTVTGDSPTLTPQTIDLTPIQNEYVGAIAFGRYSSPDYLVHPYQYIPAVGTRNGTPEVKGWDDIYFNLYLPSGTKPLNGWPVAIFVHGINGSKEETALNVVTSLAKHGVATITINDVGHGFGPESMLSVDLNGATTPITFKAGGRGIDQNGDSKIGSSEGIQVSGKRRIVFFSDTYRQTAADLVQLAREIEVGMDVDGDGRPDIDPARIYLLPHSLGSGIGTVFFAVEPDVRVGVIDVPFDPASGGPLSCKWRFAGGIFLFSRAPSLINSSKIMALDGCTLATQPGFPPAAFSFNEDFPLRDGLALTVGLKSGSAIVSGEIQSPVTDPVDGAMALQEGLENLKWVSRAGSPLAYAPYLRKAPLAGVQPKSLLFLMAKGDQTAPNPSNSAIVRAGDLADVTLYYRHDLYYADNHDSDPTLDKSPHSFALKFGDISQSVQEMIGKFFESDGSTLIAPQGDLSMYFEFPIVLPLPEGLNYSSIQ